MRSSSGPFPANHEMTMPLYVRLVPCLLAIALASPVAAQQRSGPYPEAYYRAPEPSLQRKMMMLYKEIDAEAAKDLPAPGGSVAGLVALL